MFFYYTYPEGATVDSTSLPADCTTDETIRTVRCGTNFGGLAPVQVGQSASVDVPITLPAGATTSHQLFVEPRWAFYATPNDPTSNNDGPRWLSTQDPNPSNNTVTTSSLTQTMANLSVSVSGPTELPISGNTIIELTVLNSGPDTSGTYTATVTIPPGVTIIETQLPAGCSITDSTVTCQGEPLENGSSNTFPIPITTSGLTPGGESGPLETTVSSTGASEDPNEADNTNSQSIPIAVRSDLAISGEVFIDDNNNGIPDLTEDGGIFRSPRR